jgi:hypothetical protein
MVCCSVYDHDAVVNIMKSNQKQESGDKYSTDEQLLLLFMCE